jgi:hypothetical protein
MNHQSYQILKNIPPYGDQFLDYYWNTLGMTNAKSGH